MIAPSQISEKNTGTDFIEFVTNQTVGESERASNPLVHDSNAAVGEHLPKGLSVDYTYLIDTSITFGLADCEQISPYEAGFATRWNKFNRVAPSIRFVPHSPDATDQRSTQSAIGRLFQLNVVDSLENESDVDGIVSALRFLNFDRPANRIATLHRLCEDDPGETSIVVKSLRRLAVFLVTETYLPIPRIAVSPDGLMQIEWRLDNNGIVAIKFLANGQLEFAAISGRFHSSVAREHVGGTHRKQFVLNAIAPFIR